MTRYNLYTKYKTFVTVRGLKLEIGNLQIGKNAKSKYLISNFSVS